MVYLNKKIRKMLTIEEIPGVLWQKLTFKKKSSNEFF